VNIDGFSLVLGMVIGACVVAFVFAMVIIGSNSHDKK